MAAGLFSHRIGNSLVKCLPMGVVVLVDAEDGEVKSIPIAIFPKPIPSAFGISQGRGEH